MSRLVGITALLVLLTALVAGIGGWIGVGIGLHQTRARVGLDQIVHADMHLTGAQDRQIAALETDFARRRQGLQTEMRAANVELADAIVSEHAYGPDAQRAVERLHKAMGALQEETIRHVLAMRTVMTPPQAKHFDTVINRALKPPAA